MTSVGKALPHDSAMGHVTGRALYVEDLPRIDGELWVDFAGAPCAAGKIKSIDTSKAAAIEGVIGVYTHDAIGGKNHFGPIFHDEPFLVEQEIMYLGQPVVVVAATTRDAARHAVASVEIDCEVADPILEIEDAIAAGTYLGPHRRIARGDLEVAFETAPHMIEGTFHSNGQEQFYLESQACQAIPGELNQLKLISSTQNPTETQAVVAEVLGLQMHQVVCECKRMGGGFGGKETSRPFPH